MWFAYVENSMAWYDLDIDDVKEMIRLNKKGKESPALEDMRRSEGESLKSIDLIQENNVDRFEKNKGRNRNRKPNNKPNNRNRNNNHTNNTDKNNVVKEGGKGRNTEGNKPTPKPTEGNNNKPTNKKFKRRPPKNNNNKND